LREFLLQPLLNQFNRHPFLRHQRILGELAERCLGERVVDFVRRFKKRSRGEALLVVGLAAEKKQLTQNLQQDRRIVMTETHHAEDAFDRAVDFKIPSGPVVSDVLLIENERDEPRGLSAGVRFEVR
jgi:hypothetical protein